MGEASIKVIDPTCFTNEELESLDFLIEKNQEENCIDLCISLISPSYVLQFPKRLRNDTETDEIDDEESHFSVDEKLMEPVDDPEQFWLNSKHVIDSLSNVDMRCIFESMCENRPFVTPISFKEEIIAHYKRFINTTESVHNHLLIDSYILEEYLNRIFSMITPSVTLEIEMGYCIKAVMNKWNKICLEVEKIEM